MNSFTSKKLIKVIVFSSSIIFSSFIPGRINADVSECPESGSANANEQFIIDLDSTDSEGGGCLLTPEKFEMTIYEMGLCATNPISGTAGSKVWDKSSCTTTMISSTGETVDLAPGDSSSSKLESLPSAETRPPSGRYTHAFVLLSTEFGLRGSYTMADGTRYYSTPGINEYNYPYGLPVVGSAPAQDHKDIVNEVGESETNPMEMSPVAFPESQGGGKVSALLFNACDYLTNQCNGISAKAASAADAVRLFAVFEPKSPVVISNETKGLEIELSVKGTGYYLNVNQGVGVEEFGSAPFRPKFKTF